MDEFLNEIEEYARAVGIRPATVPQKAANLSGTTLARWRDRTSSPTLRTIEKIRAYIAANPPQTESAAQ